MKWLGAQIKQNDTEDDLKTPSLQFGAHDTCSSLASGKKGDGGGQDQQPVDYLHGGIYPKTGERRESNNKRGGCSCN